jgi:hypothetical protein
MSNEKKINDEQYRVVIGNTVSAFLYETYRASGSMKFSGAIMQIFVGFMSSVFVEPIMHKLGITVEKLNKDVEESKKLIPKNIAESLDRVLYDSLTYIIINSGMKAKFSTEGVKDQVIISGISSLWVYFM